MPQSIAAIVLKMFMPKILTRFGYRKVLISNTLILGLVIGLFAIVGVLTPIWIIVMLACFFGFFSSLQYTSMNTLVFADVNDSQTGMASTIVSTAQQMSMSFGVATASLVTAYFVPDRKHTSPTEMIQSLHHAFIFLGLLTVVSSAVFYRLKDSDGDSISHHHSPLQTGLMH